MMASHPNADRSVEVVGIRKLTAMFDAASNWKSSRVMGADPPVSPPKVVVRYV
jgi:hypothetical protein